MTESEKFTRRDLLAAGTIFTLGGSLAANQPVEAIVAPHSVSKASFDTDFKTFSRYRPSYGGPPSSPHYLGKLMPRLRAPGQAPVPVVAPDTTKLPFRMVAAWK